MVESTLPRLDILELAERHVFDDQVISGELEWPRHGITVRFERHDEDLMLTAPFAQLLSTVRRSTPTDGEFRHFLCPRCDAERRILHLVPLYESCGCHRCLSLTYESSNASGSPRNKAIARYKSLERGRRRPPGGQAAHEERLLRAEDDAMRKIWASGQALLLELWGVDEPREDPFGDALRAEWRAVFDASDVGEEEAQESQSASG